MKQKNLFGIKFIVLILISAACSSVDGEKVKLGISGTDTRKWEFVAVKTAEEGIDIEIIPFNDYDQTNTYLEDAELDVNSFQTVAYFDEFIKEHDLDLVPIATTYLAPMAIYSDKYSDINGILDGAAIAIPNDTSNQGRALLLLQEAGLLELVDDYDGLGSISEAVVANPKNLELVEMA